MIAGVNLDYRNPVGSPSASQLAGFRYARFQYDVSGGTGSLDFEAAHRLYDPRIDALLAAGITPIIVATHRLRGEGRGFNWNRMSAGDWSRYTLELVEAIRLTAARYAGRGLIWQIGNEHDQASEASIYMPPAMYGDLFNRAYRAVRSVDDTAAVITAGMVSGPASGAAYVRAAGIEVCFGVALHPYDAGAGGRFEVFAPIDAQLAAWEALSLPLWVTEFGVLDQPGAAVGEVAAMGRRFGIGSILP